ncbi:MAG: Eco57I restriction-modification methylase domain-containing protein, partial [Candidatus Hodarchaeales archaeon]|jgi:hypothetical protein
MTTKYFKKYYQWQPGEKNLFKLFLERFYTLCHPKGIFGIIVPGGILGEFYCQPLRSTLLTQTRILLILEAISNHEMFPDAEPGLSILIILAQKSESTKEFPFIKSVTSIANVSSFNLKKLSGKSKNIIFFTQDDILTSPSQIIPAVRNQSELQVVKKISQYPSFSSTAWSCKTSRGIDMTNDRHLLVKKAKTQFPLIEGRHLVRLGYDDTHPRFWIRSFKEYQERIPFWDQKIIAWKNFSGNHRRRRMRIAILPPKTVISNSVICLYNLPKIDDVEYYIAGMMCSIPFEFRIRQLCYGININQYIIDNVTVPLFDPNHFFHRKMVLIVKEFVPRGKEWAKRKMEATSSLSKARLEIDYQDSITAIDAMSALIYKLTKDDFKLTLDAHPQLETSYKVKSLKLFDFIQGEMVK